MLTAWCESGAYGPKSWFQKQKLAVLARLKCKKYAEVQEYVKITMIEVKLMEVHSFN